MPKDPLIIQMETTNTLMGGCYTARIQVGPGRVPANVLLDTGSSTLALHEDIFEKGGFQPTNFAQHVEYGAGGWRGPVVRTSVVVGAGEKTAELRDVPAAVIVQGRSTAGGGEVFEPADGILGLAYCKLNKAVDLGRNTFQGFTEVEYGKGNPVEIEPYFTALEEHGILANKFSFYLLRSSTHFRFENPRQDPMNQGYLILGGGEECTHLYEGALQSAKIVDDLYYNTNLRAIRVGDSGSIRVPAGGPTGSNSIVDTGVDKSLLPPPLYKKIVERLPKGSPVTAADLAAWPDLEVTLEGENGDVVLRIGADSYWQLHADARGKSELKIQSGGDAPFVVLGLPLMSSYFTIYDRSAAAGRGVIKFGRVRKHPQPRGTTARQR